MEVRRSGRNEKTESKEVRRTNEVYLKSMAGPLINRTSSRAWP
jgi:hypothetical protein